MTGPNPPVRLIPFDEEALVPYGTIIRPPPDAGERQIYTACLGEASPGTSIRMHTNMVRPSVLPYPVTQLERHPRTAQIFIPLDVSRYVVLVTPSREDGDPELSRALAMIVPGDRGIAFAVGAWHAGATVLDRIGSFCVLHHRGDTPEDDEFLAIEHPFLVQI